MFVFMQEGMKHLSNQQRRIEKDRFSQLYQKTLICMQIDTAQARHCNLLPWGRRGLGDTAKCKRFPQKICQNPHLYLRVISYGYHRISLGFVSMQPSSCEMQICFFCIGALPTTNDSWGNQGGLDPLSYRCVCIG